MVTISDNDVQTDGSPNNFKRQLLYLLTPEEQLELAEKKVRVRLVKYVPTLSFTYMVSSNADSSLWRPVLKVETGPLAFCDIRTVAEEDWEPVDKVFDDWVEESMYLKHNPAHKWYWLSDQTPDDVSTFVIWDSENPDNKNGE